MDTYIVLGDNTFAEVTGCRMVRVYELNEAALKAADDGDGQRLLELADEVIDLKENIGNLSVFDV